jgi:hypothetical protein
VNPAAGAHALLILDKAAWHTTRKLKPPANVTLVPLPPACPELNPAEDIWQYLRQTYRANRVFETQTDILDACQDAWRNCSPAIALDLAADVADDAAEVGAQLLEHPVGALERLGVGITLMLDQGELAHPRIRLAQSHRVKLRQLHQLLARLARKP